ncbi:MAG: 30S ribosomal protein S9 [Nitrospirae bacterium]|nr:30S ribosomal protein S9 [Nitrospirota bacterium]
MPATKKKKEETTPKPKSTFKGKYFYANGKRKTSVAKVRLYKGDGKIIINNKLINEFVPIKTLIGLIKFPFKVVGAEKQYDVSAKVEGGGVTSQAEAVRHGIAKGLIEADPLSKPSLKKAGLLTRDSRTKERKKFGLKRARKGPQFSKR